MTRSVQVDFTPKEAHAVASALDLAAHIMDCCEERENTTDLRMLRDRVRNGAVVGDLEEQLGL